MKKIKLIELLNHEDGLFKLTSIINWDFLELSAGVNYVEGPGRPKIKTRLIVGLHYLKYLENKSDEEAVKTFLHNPYWQYFCGNEYFEHNFPIHPSTLSRWRNKLGLEKVEKLLEETINAAKREMLIKEKDFKKLNIDTTVQEKNITFPTDAKLLHKMRRKLVMAAQKRNLTLRQSYERLGQAAFIMQCRYAHSRKMKKAKKELKKLKNYLGRVIRDIERNIANPDKKLESLLNIAKKLFMQKKDDKNKIYSIHEQDVECIAKGKSHKKYEFGCKVSITSTVTSNWIVGANAFHSNPYDGHTLIPSIAQVERLVGQRPTVINADQGFKGEKNHPEGISVLITGKKNKSSAIKKFMKKRSAIEPIIGHLKSDHRLTRNYLKGKLGDMVNCILSACAFNLKKILNSMAIPKKVIYA